MELQIGEALTSAKISLAAPTLKTLLDYREEDTKKEGAFEVGSVGGETKKEGPSRWVVGMDQLTVICISPPTSPFPCHRRHLILCAPTCCTTPSRRAGRRLR